MTVVVSSGFVVSPGIDGLNAHSPIIGYENRVTSANVTATTEDAEWPASNLATPSTYLKWRSNQATSEEFLTVTLNTAEFVDYLAVARHNFGSNQTAVSVEGQLVAIGAWTELVEERLLANDNPVIFRFTAQPLFAIRLRIQEPQAAVPAAPFAAVMYVGRLLLLQRRIYVGHTPQPLGRRTQFANQRSIAGDFLGRIQLSESTETSVDLRNLTPDWYRTYFDPFVLAARQIPFFFNWRPGDYPNESSYAWLTADPRPQNQSGNGMMQVQFDLEGIVT